MRVSVSIQIVRGGPSAAGRRRFLVPVLLLGLVLPGVVLASDTFPDVPNSNIFHADINRVYGARVAAGCGGGNYCPSQNVTREQMAAFLSRVGSRAAEGSGSALVAENVFTDLATISIRPGNVTGGTAFILVTGTVTAYTIEPDLCPCTIAANILQVQGGEASLDMFETISDTGAPWGNSTFRFGSIATTWVFAAPTGDTATYKLRIKIRTTAGSGGLVANGNLTAVYAPFGPQGDANLSPG